MKRPDRGAKSYVGGVASSSVPRGRKDRGQGRSSRDRTRAIHIRCLWAGVQVPATREKHLIRSLFATCASLACTLSFPDLKISLLLLQSRIPPDPRVAVFPSVADKTSFAFPFQNSLQNPLHQIPFANSNLFPPASVHPIPILSFLTARSPLVNFYEICFPCELSRQPEQ
jgi:hypothetical protein